MGIIEGQLCNRVRLLGGDVFQGFDDNKIPVAAWGWEWMRIKIRGEAVHESPEEAAESALEALSRNNARLILDCST